MPPKYNQNLQKSPEHGTPGWGPKCTPYRVGCFLINTPSLKSGASNPLPLATKQKRAWFCANIEYITPFVNDCRLGFLFGIQVMHFLH